MNSGNIDWPIKLVTNVDIFNKSCFMDHEQKAIAPKMNCVKTVLRWAGSKRSLLPELMQRIVGLDFQVYVEPFAGSASLFFAIQPTKAFLSDINEELINFYAMLSNHPQQVYRTAKHYMEYGGGYYIVRALDPYNLSSIERSARFLYLNHFCFNGLYRTNKHGQFNVPEGKKTGGLPSEEHLICASTILKRAEISSVDFEITVNHAKPRYFYYLDPPYDYSGKRDRGDYGMKQFTVADIPRLEKMLEHIDSKGATFLLSYQDTPEIKSISQRWRTICVPVRRQIASFSKYRKMIPEVLVDNIKESV